MLSMKQVLLKYYIYFNDNCHIIHFSDYLWVNNPPSQVLKDQFDYKLVHLLMFNIYARRPRPSQFPLSKKICLIKHTHTLPLTLQSYKHPRLPHAPTQNGFRGFINRYPEKAGLYNNMDPGSSFTPVLTCGDITYYFTTSHYKSIVTPAFLHIQT